MQENLIRDDNKLILLASLSDSLEYMADAIERYVLHMTVCDVIVYCCFTPLICYSLAPFSLAEYRSVDFFFFLKYIFLLYLFASVL